MIDRLRPTERLLYAGDTVCIGTFSCCSDDPQFDEESPSTAHCIVFARTAVWIHHEGGRRFVADPTVVTFHNRGRLYRRWRVADPRDRCDWIAYSDDVLEEAVTPIGPARQHPLWFPREWAPVGSLTYARQRRLFERAGAGVADAAEIEEQAVLLLDRALEDAAGAVARWSLRPARGFDAVQQVRAIIARTPSRIPPLRSLAAVAEMTPFQLCRAFSRVCGETMTAYRLRLRLLLSLERLRAGDAITDVALAHGFSSHSHFTAAFRRLFGVPPSAWKQVRPRVYS